MAVPESNRKHQMLQINENQPVGVTVASIEGKMTLGTELMFLEGDLKKLIEGGAKRVVLDLGGVPTIDSAGLGVLISTAALLRRAGGDIRLVRLSQKLQEIFDIVRVHQVLPVLADVPSAVASLSESS